MLSREVANYFFIVFIALANGMPQNPNDEAVQKSGPLPFLQFTNGGIRVNFAGYHAEAGLGGLLRGGPGGGLHASAGTPWGAHATAGLGGQLSGEDSSLGGGLYARAGLGHGRPEAAAGIGGKLDGSGRSLTPISGGMYAGATRGGPGTGVYLGGGIDKDVIDAAAGAVPVYQSDENPRAVDTPKEATADVTTPVNIPANEAKPTKGHTNIQIIRSKPKNTYKEKEKVVLEATALPSDALTKGKDDSQNNETRRATSYVVVPSATKIDALESPPAQAPAVKSVEKSIVIPALSPVAVPKQGIQADVNSNIITRNNNNSNIISRMVYPRWYLRKKFWTAPRKVLYFGPTVTDSQSASSNTNDGSVTKVAGNNGLGVAGKTYTDGSLFNDIFNIPISTLVAVNQLLRNNVG